MRIVVLNMLLVLSSANLGLAGEVNVSAELNAALRSKPPVRYELCKSPIRPDICDSFFVRIGSGASMGTQPVTYPAVVASSSVIRVDSIHFDSPHLAKLPEITLLTHKLMLNCGDDNLTSSVTLSVAGTKSWSVSKTDGVSTTNGASISGTLPVVSVGTLNTGLTWNQTISSSTTKSEGEQQTVTRSTTDTVNIQPKRAIDFYLIAYQETLEIPFSATVVVDGELLPNQSGIQNASSLLSVAERTFPVKGTLQLSDVSDSTVRTDDVQGGAGCSGSTTPLVIRDDSQQSFPTSKTATFLRSGFVTEQQVERQGSTLAHVLRQFGSLAAAEGPSIGPADGTQYEVLYTTEVAEPAPGQCGFNDIGVPNAGLFTVEARQYRTYANGKLISEWQQNVETFKSCYTP